ncbi:hypothetical protein BKA62DRAFT_700916 [Auriculariales sp. MPI-PUGE-AT-0066]|nr:hypothetical protein BKA62DRAFT_700916 [Auriculariales sp. MPI-PUGE-AT-0066]
MSSRSSQWRGESNMAPRTPHSARSMAHAQQAQPLLRPSDTSVYPGTPRLPGAEFTYTSHGRRKQHSVGLIIGSLVAFVILVLLALSLWKPTILHEYIVGSEGDLVAVQDPVDSLPDPPGHAEHAVQLSETHTTMETSGHEHQHSRIDYSGYTSFPLTSQQYAQECANMFKGPHKHSGYWADSGVDVSHRPDSQSRGKTCASTITYMLDGSVGVAADLAYMAQFAALARERNRTFLIHDDFWNRGRFSDYFEDVRKTQPVPDADCLPPPPEEYVACPRTARHWIVSARTAKYHLGHDFFDEYEDAFKVELDRQFPLYERARTSLLETIRPNPDILSLISAARPQDSYVGLHIRRGDQSPRAWKWRKQPGGYVPLSEYAAGARAVGASAVWAASDMTGEIFDELMEELGHHVTIHGLARAGEKKFWELSPWDEAGYVQKKWMESHLSVKERRKLTVGALVDLALLSGLWMEDPDKMGPQATVCTYASNVCRLAALGLGWDKAFGKGTWAGKGARWVDVDTHGSLMPAWSAFNLFS